MTSTPRLRSGCTLSARLLLGVGILLAGVLPDRAEEALSSGGEALYRTRCASCHEGGVARAPDTNALRQYRPERMSFALMFGMMSQQGRDLSQGEIQDIVRYLVGAPPQQQQPLPDSKCREQGPVLAELRCHAGTVGASTSLNAGFNPLPWPSFRQTMFRA
jgi:polyvinyl alcohol dehydrogenase (cytochrome)